MKLFSTNQVQLLSMFQGSSRSYVFLPKKEDVYGSKVLKHRNEAQTSPVEKPAWRPSNRLELYKKLVC